jgi:TPP-dependent pyruvate/acetoin dehydrogenase alpha subunit
VDALIASEALTTSAYATLQEAADKEVMEAWRRAQAAPYPPESRLLDLVYAEGSRCA